MRIKINHQKRKSIALKMVLDKVVLDVPENIEVEPERILREFLSQVKKGRPQRNLSREEFLKLVESWQGRMELYPKRIQLREMKQKWASCSENKIITFNRLLLSMPKDFCDYVICHELLHLRFPFHNKLFNSFLASYLPNWQETLRETVKFLIER